MATNYIKQARELFQKVGNRVQQLSTNPILSPGGYLGKKIANYAFPEGKSVVKQLSTPQGQEQFQKSPATNLQQNVRQYIGNRYVAPIAQVPYNLKQTFGPNKSFLERGVGALGVLGGTVAMIPDPIGDIGLPLYDYAKGVGAAKTSGNGFVESQKSGLRSLTGQQNVGIGTALGQKGIPELALNFAELPLMLLASGRTKKSKDLDLAVKRSQPIIENAVLALRQYDRFSPADQIKIIDQAERVAKEFIPEIMANKEFKKFSISQPSKYLEQLANFLENRVVVANHPEINIGLKTQAIKRIDNAQATKGGVPEGGVTGEAKRLLDVAKQRWPDLNESQVMNYAKRIAGADKSVEIQPQHLAEALQLAHNPDMGFVNTVSLENLFSKKGSFVKDFSGSEIYQRRSDLGITENLDTQLPTLFKSVNEKAKRLSPDSQKLLETYINRTFAPSRDLNGARLNSEQLKQIDTILTKANTFSRENGNSEIQKMDLIRAFQKKPLVSLQPEGRIPTQATVREFPIPEKQILTTTQISQTPPTPTTPKVPGSTLANAEDVLPSSGIISNGKTPYYNLSRVGGGDEAQKLIKDQLITPEIKSQIERVVGKTLSHQEVKKYVQISEELNKTLTREDALSLGRSALALRNRVADLAKSGLVGEDFNEALIRDKAFGAYLARLLGQRRIVSDPAQKTIYNKLIAEILKTGTDPDEVVEASKGVDLNNFKQATEFYRKFVKATLGNWMDKLRYNSMLTSPTTHLINISSNVQGTGILTPIQKTIEGGIDSVVSAVTGRKRTRFAGEGAEYFKGYVGSVKEAYKKMGEVFKGERFVENPDIRSIPLSTGGPWRTVENVLDVSTKALESMDQFFKTLTEGGLKRAYKYRLSKGGADLSARAAGEANKLLFRGELMEPGAGVLSNAIGGGAKWVQQATHSQSTPVRWLAKLTFPFVRIGTNITKAGVEGNPLLGAVNMIGNTDKIAQASKMIMGGTVMAIGGSLALADRLTFGEPIDAKNKNAMRAAKIPPYSFKVGDTWISYSKFHPLIAFQLATVAALNQARKDAKMSDNTAAVVAEGLFNSLKFVADQSYFKNIGDFVNSAYGDLDSVSRLPANYLSQAIPFRALMSWVERVVDRYQRKPDPGAGFFTQAFQQVASQIPGLANTVPPRLGPTGEPIQTPLGERIINAVLPAKVSKEDSSKRMYYDFATNALRSYKNLQNLPPEEAAKIYRDLKKYKPQLASQIEKIARDQALKITGKETRIRSLGVENGERARAIKKELLSVKDPEERVALWKKYVKLGIITDEVKKQLVKM